MFPLNLKILWNNLHPILKNTCNIHSCSSPLYFKYTPVLWAEPLRKKKKLDPAMLKEKAEKRARRIMRDIRRLEKVAKKLKPIAELEVPRVILRDKERKRLPPVLSNEEIEERIEHQKEWTKYKREQHLQELSVIKRMIASQERAMDELKKVSPWLYERALQIDPELVPYKMVGPVRTPPIPGYEYPDGEFINVTKKYLPIVPVEVKKNKKRIGLKKK